MTWQPIESAPKDGSYFIMANSLGAWVGTWEPLATSGYTFGQPWRSRMLNHNHIPIKGRYSPPTHWMPLPKPPE